MAPGYPTEVSSKVRHHMEGEFSYFLNFSKLIRFPNPEWVGKHDYKINTWAILVNMEISVILGHEKTKIQNILD